MAEFSDLLEEFGQRESLTSRLRNILRQYPEGPGVLFELIQNADDAKATEVNLVLDHDTHGTETLFGGRMARWQGPALFAHNNSVFTSRDFDALSRIGQGSKLEKMNATGRFGLGFNATYHFTDVPSIVSSDSLVIFDPHARDVPGATERSPGIRIPLTRLHSKFDKYKDQLSPYRMLGCDIKKSNHYAGTLFRFPLRTAAAALQSEIKPKALSPSDVMCLFELFRSVATQSLLFLRHVTRVAVWVRRRGAISRMFEARLADINLRKTAIWHKMNETLMSPDAPAAGAPQRPMPQNKKAAFYSRFRSVPDEKLPCGPQRLDVILDEADVVEYSVTVGSEKCQVKTLKNAQDRSGVEPSVNDGSSESTAFATPAAFGIQTQESVVIGATGEAQRLGVAVGSSIIAVAHTPVARASEIAAAWRNAKSPFRLELRCSAEAFNQSVVGSDSSNGSDEKESACLTDTKGGEIEQNDQKSKEDTGRAVDAPSVGSEPAVQEAATLTAETKSSENTPPATTTPPGSLVVEPNPTPNPKQTTAIESYLLFEALGGKRARDMALDPNRRHLKLLPWAGVAALLSRREGGPDSTARPARIQHGRAFCFLPLPCFTGLPVHINGYFELSSNRRDIWWGADMAGDGAMRSQWNKVVLEDVVAGAYCKLLLEARAGHQETQLTPSGSLDSDSWFWLWPRQTTSEAWEVTTRKVYSELAHLPVLRAPTEPGSKTAAWTCPKDCVLASRADSNHTTFQTALATHLEFAQAGRRVVAVPDGVYARLRDSASVESLSPSVARSWLRRMADTKPRDWRWDARWDLGLFLLEYCAAETRTGDSTDEKVLEALCDLPVIPLLSKRFAVLRGASGVPCKTKSDEAKSDEAKSDKAKSDEAKSDEAKAGEAKTGEAKDPMDRTTEMIYLVNGEEARLFKGAANCLVHGDTPRSIRTRFERLATAGLCNLSTVTLSAVARILGKTLPVSWKNLTEVLWRKSGSISGSGGDEKQSEANMSSKWLSDLWAYLTRSNKVGALTETPYPLVPTRGNVLCRLQKYDAEKIKLILPGRLNERVLSLLTRLGCHCVDVDIVPASPALASFAQPATATGALQALRAAASQGEKSSDYWERRFESSSVTISEREALRALVSDECLRGGGLALDAPLAEMLGRLPIFELFAKGSGGDTPIFAAAATGKHLPPPNISHSLLQSDFIRPRLTRDVDLAQALGARELPEVEFYVGYILEAIETLTPASRDSAMLMMLRSLPRLGGTKGGSKLRAAARSAKCIPTGEDKARLCRPGDLYDPEVKVLTSLLDKSRWFPSKSFSAPDVLLALRGLGLRSVLDRPAALECARTVHANADSQTAVPLARKLLQALDLRAAELLNSPEKKTGESKSQARSSSDEWAAEMRSLRWVPVLTRSPDPSLPWPTHDTNPPLSTASSTRPASEMWFVSATLSLLDGAVRSAELRNALGWQAKAPLSALTRQVTAMSEKLSSLAAGDEKQAQAAAALRIAAGRHVPALMERIFAHLTSGGEKSLTAIQTALARSESVWVGTQFVRPDQVAFEASLDAKPFLFVVPPALASVRQLLAALGVRNTFMASDYLEVLRQMLKQYRAGTPPSRREIDLAILIAQFLFDCSQAVRGTVPLPDDSGGLHLAPSMYFNDAPWLRDDTPRTFVHGKLSNAVARKLGAKSLREQLIASSSSGLNSGLGLQTESFGQRESLTRRLQNILRQYPEGPGTLFEFIQNADDACATTVTFLLNLDSYPKTSLLAPSMRAWQGAALYVHNDATFSAEDLVAVSRIGQGSKLGSMGKTGRFGLGFNSCYHFTDVPSFVSGDALVMFDPHARSLPGANARDPGLLVRFGDDKQRIDLLKSFPHQFEPYLFYGCTLRQRYKGTLFRFPLRTVEAARLSGVKDKPCTVPAMLSLFAAFEEAAASALLFLRHVRRVRVQVRARGRTVDLFEAGLEDPTARSKSVWRTVTKSLRSAESRREFYHFLSVTDETKLPRGEQTLHIRTTRFRSFKDAVSRGAKAEKINVSGSGDAADASGATKPALADTKDAEKDAKGSSGPAAAADKCRYPHDNLVVQKWFPELKTAKISIDEYLLYEMLGGGEARKMAVSQGAEQHKLLPWAGVAALLSRREGGPDSTARPARIQHGRAFCFLPLPCFTGLPVHINGYFELSSNRRDIWWGADMAGDGGLRSRWNRHLLADVVAEAYASLLVIAAKRLRGGSSPSQLSTSPNTDPYALWPRDASSEAWSVTLKEVFKRLSTKPVLYSAAAGGQWCIPSDAVIVPMVGHEAGPNTAPESKLKRSKSSPATLPTDAATRKRDQRLFQILSNCDVPVVNLQDQSLRKRLEETGRGPKIATAEFVRWWYATLPSAPPPRCTRQDTLVLLAYCLRDAARNKSFSDMAGLRMLPLADGTWGEWKAFSGDGFKDGNYFVGDERVLDLFPADRGRFIAHDIGAELKKRLFGNQTLRKQTNIKEFSPVVAAALVARAIPAPWRGRAAVQWDTKKVSTKWLQRIWAYMSKIGDWTPFASSLCPLVPTRGGVLCALALKSKVVHTGEKGFPKDVEPLLRKLQCHCLDSELVLSAKDAKGSNSGGAKSAFPDAMWTYIHRGTAKGVLQCLKLALCGALDGSAGAKSGPKTDEKSPPRSNINAMFASARVTATERDALRHLIARQCVSGGQLQLTEPEAEFLKTLPLFPTFGSETFGSVRHAALHGRRLPPIGVDSRLLTSHFLKDSKLDSALYEALGVTRENEPNFYTRFVFERKQNELIPRPVHEAAVVEVLMQLPRLSKMTKGAFTEYLKKCEFVPNARGGVVLARPGDLFDPSVPKLRELLGKENFPSPTFQSESVLAALRTLGLRTHLGREGVLKCARALEKDAKRPGGRQSEVENKKAAEVATTAVACAKKLLSLLDAQEDDFFGMPSEPGASEEKDVEKRDEKSSGDSKAESDSKDAKLSSDIPEWIQELRQIAWLPVLASPTRPGLPWPPSARTEGTRPRLFTASETRRKSDDFLCSYTMRLIDFTFTSPALTRALGLDAPLPARVLVAQIRRFAAIYNAAAEKINRGEVSGEDYSVLRLPELYRLLWARMEGNPAAQGLARKSLPRGVAWVWVGAQAGFVTPGRVAIDPGVDCSPYLFQAPNLCKPYASLLKSLGVKQAFDRGDLAALLARMGAKRKGSPLSQDDLILSVRALKRYQELLPDANALSEADAKRMAVLLLPNGRGVLTPANRLIFNDAPWISDALGAGQGGLDFCNSSVDNELAAALGVKGFRSALLSQKSAEKNIPCTSADIVRERLAALDAAVAGPVAVDEDEAAASADAVANAASAGDAKAKAQSRDDSQNTTSKETGGKDEETKSTPGASVPTQQPDPSNEIVEPVSIELILDDEDPAGARRRTPADDAAAAGVQAIMDLVEVSDLARAHRFEVAYDEQLYGAQSLFTPLLAGFQGPALLFRFDAPLSYETVLTLQQRLAAGGRRCAQERYLVQADTTHFGSGFMSAYVYGDVLQLVSGQHFYILDPSRATYIDEAKARAAAAGARSGGKAAFKVSKASAGKDRKEQGDAKKEQAKRGSRVQGYGRVFGIGGSGLCARFPDQFAPFTKGPFKMPSGKPYPGTILRIPLRTAGSPLSQRAWDPSRVVAVLEKFAESMVDTLLFSRHLESMEVRRGPRAVGKAVMFSKNLSTLREKRRELLAGNDWHARSGLMSLFSSWVPKSVSYRMGLAYTGPKGQKGTQDWIVSGMVGSQAARNAALAHSKRLSQLAGLHPVLHHAFVPVAAVAARLDTLSDDAKADSKSRTHAVRGKLFCGQPLPHAETGLPVHVHAFFALDSAKRARFDPGAARRDAEWNNVLVTDAISDAYCELLMQVRDLYKVSRPNVKSEPNPGFLKGPKSNLYSLWPLLSDLKKAPCVGAGLPARALLQAFHARASQHDLYLNTAGAFTKPKLCMFPTNHTPKQVASLVARQVPVCVAPTAVTRDALAFAQGALGGALDAPRARKLLRAPKVNAALVRIERKTQLEVLRFVLDGLQGRQYEEIRGLNLVPLDSGIGCWGRRRYVLATHRQQKLLPLKAQYIAAECLEDAKLRAHLVKTDMQTRYLVRFAPRFLAQRMTTLFDRELRRSTAVAGFVSGWDAVPSSVDDAKRQAAGPSQPMTPGPARTKRGLPTRQWLRNFWAEMDINNADIRQLFRGWPLLPLHARRPAASRAATLPQPELAAVELYTDRVLRLPTSARGAGGVREDLLTIGIPILDESYFVSDGVDEKKSSASPDSKDATESVASPSRPAPPPPCDPAQLPLEVLRVIQRLHAAHPTRVRFDAMTPQQANRLLRLFAQGFESGLFQGDNAARLRETLQRLPLYQMLSDGVAPDAPADAKVGRSGRRDGSGSPRGLATHSGYRDLAHEPDNFMVDTKTKFPPSFESYLRHNESFLTFRFPDFHRWLGVNVLTKREVLERFLVKSSTFGDVGGSASLDTVVQDIRRDWKELRSEGIEDQLRILPFVPASLLSEPDLRGPRCRPDELLDPRNAMFAALFATEEVFPGGPYRDASWLDFLCSVGLTHKITAGAFVRCAEKLAELGARAAAQGALDAKESISGVSKSELASLANRLVAILWREAATYSRAMPDFWERVSAAAFVPALDPDTKSLRFWKFSDTALERDFNLIWSCRPVLSASLTPPPARLSALGVESPPSVALILTHIGRVTRTSLSDLRSRLRDQLSTRERSGTIESMFKSLFSFLETAWDELPSGAAEALRLTKIVPVGPRLVRPSRLFIRLEQNLFPFMFEVPRVFGAHDKLLQRLGARAAPGPADYVRVLAEIRAETQPQPLNVNELSAVIRVVRLLAAHAGADAKRNWPGLCVPDTTGRLVPARDCVVNNDPRLARRVAAAGDARIRFAHARLPPDACQRLGIQKLSVVFREVLVRHVATQPSESAPASSLRRALKTAEFARGCLRVWEDELLRTRGRVDWRRLPDAQAVRSILSKLEVVYCSSLETAIKRQDGDGNDKPRSTSAAADGKNLEMTGDVRAVSHLVVGHRVYIVADATSTGVYLPQPSTTLATVAARLMSAKAPGLPPLREVSSIAAIFESPRPDAIPDVLDELSVRRIDRVAALRGVPGEVVAAADRKGLLLNPLHVFSKGETVAWRPDSDGTTAGAPKYGVVVSIEKDALTSLSRVHVDTGAEKPKQLLSSGIYCFRPTAVEPLHNDGKSVIQQSDFENERNDNGNVDAKSSTPGPKAAASAGGATPPSPGPSAGEDKDILLRAVQSILSRAGLPMSVAQRDLVRANAELRAEIERLKGQVSGAREAKSRAEGKVQEVKEAFICGICQTVDVDTVLVPCGHLLCTECIGKLRRRQCPYCREPWQSTTRFFCPVAGE